MSLRNAARKRRLVDEVLEDWPDARINDGKAGKVLSQRKARLRSSAFSHQSSGLETMCGICGQFKFIRQDPVESETIRRMTATIAHRGPDDEGYHFDGPLGFG